MTRSSLSKLKAKQLLLLKDIEKELANKYSSDPRKLEEIRRVVEVLEKKIRELRSRTLYSYVATLLELCEVYPEFRVMVEELDEIWG